MEDRTGLWNPDRFRFWQAGLYPEVRERLHDKKTIRKPVQISRAMRLQKILILWGGSIFYPMRAHSVQHKTTAGNAATETCDLSDGQIDAWVTGADSVLDEAIKIPARSAEAALLALDIVIDEFLSDPMRLGFEDKMLSLARAARTYFASQVRL